MSTPGYANRLIHEKSPYLLQHAHNPVDWFPWGKEAFEKAKKEDKPIFLSIGYATCHWCHVMAEETFKDAEIGKLLNETFVNIKVDREELPEVDSLYMEFAQALMSSAGGWPLNLVLTTDLKPFFAVTYLPPRTRKGLIGMDQFIKQMQLLWQSEERNQLIAQADKIVQLFEKSAKSNGEDLPTAETIQNAVQMLLDIADPVCGGIRGEPKFPLGYQADFLLEYSKLKNESRALFYVELTLNAMSKGGIYDHLAGGFARYSIDEKWRIPHFEKMLYDNAILAESYLQTWKFTKKEKFLTPARETFDYLLREMMHPQGGFYSAQDADSDGHEGLFYTWKMKEIQEILPPEGTELFCRIYGVSQEGNFEGRNVLYLEASIDELAQMMGVAEKDLQKKLQDFKQILLKKREQRPQPFKDDKIITSWNGLMIDALAKAAGSLQEARYEQAAIKSAEFIQSYLWKDEQLFRRYRDGESRFSANLDDYAFLIKALLTLFEYGHGVKWLQWAFTLADILEKNFKAGNDAFFQVDPKTDLLIRKCEFYDGAEPSGNAVHCENLLRLYQMTHAEKYLKQAEDVLKNAKNYIETFPPGACYHLIALQRYLDVNAPTIVIALDEKNSLQKEIKEKIGSHFCPHAVFIWKKNQDQELEKSIPWIADQKPVQGQTAVYICRQDHCESPLTDKESILKALTSI